jgi:hypothetical protein
MALLTPWTARRACALQKAFRLSNILFARKLEIGSRTVAEWHRKPDLQPQSGIQQKLDTALAGAPPTVKEVFAQLIASAEPSPPVEHTPEQAADREDGSGLDPAVDSRLNTDANIGAALEWLDELTGQPPGANRRAVVSRLASLDSHELRARYSRRSRVDRQRVTEALHSYYSTKPTQCGFYQARCDDGAPIPTTILSRTTWLDLNCALGTERDRLRARSANSSSIGQLDELTADRALDRLAAIIVTGARFANMPLYQLIAADVSKGTVAGSLGSVPFVQYALTMDLLESELVEAIIAGHAQRPGSLPLRDIHLRDTATVLSLSDRLCVGGTLALCAIARPARPNHAADYLLLIQERSSQVVNAAHRLAVIPKGFHQPLSDFRADAQLGVTLLREMEEELFGREEIDNTVGNQRTADPMHPSRLSQPMRWLLAEPGRLRIECTGFGLNLVSGNYEFPGLIVIEDEEFWTTYGGQVEANWESASLRQYSSLDRDSITDLVEDVGWSNEGLFALLQGLRRLGQIGGPDRIDLPAIEWELA